jgi:hypothetical protein
VVATKIGRMPSTPLSDGCARPRPSAVVNEEIRALVASAGGWLYGASRERYELLRAEWAAATAAERMRGDVAQAA